MDALRLARDLHLSDWAIGAGAIRNVVWDRLHGYATSAPTDIDLIWFDAHPARTDVELQTHLRRQAPRLNWDVTNQAQVHQWYATTYGRTLTPCHGLADAIAAWPETATTLAVRLEADDTFTIIAPLGLHDLFDLVLRRNPAFPDVAQFQQRVRAKRFLQRWPQLVLHDAD